MYPERRDVQGKPRRKGRTLPEYLEQNEVDVLMAAAPPQAAMLMLIQWRAGLRVGEAVALDASDLSLDGVPPTLRVRRGKGNKSRIVPIHPELAAGFRTYLAYSGHRTGALVGVHEATAWRWVKKALKRAQALGALPQGKRVGTHTLRHSAARHWLANAVPINVVQRWLGHGNLATTLIYLEILPDPLGDMARVP